MPGVTAQMIKFSIKNSLLSKGYYKKSYDSNGNLIEDKSKLPDELDGLIDAISSGLADYINSHLRVNNASVTTYPQPIPGNLTEV